MQIRFTALSLLALGFSACHATPAPNTVGGGKSFIQGQATVVEVHNELGFALLSIDGKQIYGYWQSDLTLIQKGTIDSSGPWGATAGEVHEPIVQHQDFPAKPGDIIAFRGFQTGPDIFLSGIQILAQ